MAYKTKNQSAFYGVPGFTRFFYVATSVVIVCLFAVWWFQPSHIPNNFTGWFHIFDFLLFFLVSFIIWHPVMMDVLTWVIASHITDIRKQKPSTGAKVAFITTFVPGSESIELLHNCLPAMVRAKYPHDTWLLDEGNSDEVKKICANYGVHHFSRNGKDEFSNYDGKFTKTKGGNHNSWYVMHGNRYDFVAQIDTDFVPKSSFLTKTLGYFKDPSVAFVGTPQVYGNINESVIARGAAEQLYTFYGTVLKGLSNMGMTLLIGANHVIRVSALRSVNHYTAHITEDLITGMKLHTLGWRSVYISEPLAIGEGPNTWEAYFSQQMRWAYGCMDIYFRLSPKMFKYMDIRPSIYYFFLQQHYFSGIAMAISTLLLSLYFFFGLRTADVDLNMFIIFYSLVTVTCWLVSVWLQRFNIHRQEEGELLLAGKIISIAAWPVWFLAFLGIVFRKRLSYKVTPKGNLESNSNRQLSIFMPHFLIAIISIACLVSAVYTGRQNVVMLFWAISSALAMITVPFVQDLYDTYLWFIKLGKKIKRKLRIVGRLVNTVTTFTLFHSKHEINKVKNIGGREVVSDLIVISTLVFVSFSNYISKLGFYSDDWSFISNFHMTSDKSLLNLITVASTPNTYMRPVQNVYDAFLYWLFGLQPLGYHITNLITFCLLAILLYLVLLKLRFPRILSVSIATLYILLPHYSTDRFWYASHQANLSVLFFLYSLYAMLRAIDTSSQKKAWWRFQSIIAMVLSLLSYEVILPMYLIHLFILFNPFPKYTKQVVRQAKRASVFASAMVIGLFFVVFFKTITTQRLGDTIEPFYIFSLLHQAFSVNFGIWGVSLLQIWGQILTQTTSISSYILYLTVYTVLFLYLYIVIKHDNYFPTPKTSRNIVLTGISLFILGYLIFITNSQVAFSPTGIANRVAIVAGIGVAITFVGVTGWVLRAIFPKSIAQYLFCIIIALLITGNLMTINYIASHWTHAFTKNQEIIRTIRSDVVSLEKDATVLIDGVCPYSGPAPVFEGNWDVKGALQIAYNDPSLNGDIITPRIKVSEKWVSATIYTFTEYYKYEKLYIYNVLTQDIYPITSAASAHGYFREHNSDYNNNCPNAEAGYGVNILSI